MEGETGSGRKRQEEKAAPGQVRVLFAALSQTICWSENGMLYGSSVQLGLAVGLRKGSTSTHLQHPRSRSAPSLFPLTPPFPAENLPPPVTMQRSAFSNHQGHRFWETIALFQCPSFLMLLLTMLASLASHGYHCCLHQPQLS